MKIKETKSPTYYPIFLKLRGKNCVVIGGGNVALRKVEALLECGARVTLISPKPHPEVVKLSKRKVIQFIQRNYEKGDLEKAIIAFVCTNVKKVNRKVTEDAKKARILVNVADDPGSSDFIIPSFFRRGDLTIAVSTGGVSPALAKKIRSKLENSFGKEYASLLSLIGEVRSEIKREGYVVDAVTWQAILNIDLLMKLVKAESREKVRTLLLEKLRATRRGNRSALK